MMTSALQYFLHDEPDAFRIELSGRLSGEGAQSVYHAWRTALSITHARRLIVDVTYVREADKLGRALLRLWHRNGARIVAASAESCALAESIVGATLPQAPARPGLFERLKGIFHGLFTAAAFPADADRTESNSAAPAQKTAAITALPGQGELDCHMH